MKICIFGGGSIGGLLAVNLEKIGINVSIIARGQHLEVMKKNGLTLIDPTGEEKTSIVNCTDDPNSLGIQDYLFITIKSPALLPSLENQGKLYIDDQTILRKLPAHPTKPDA